MPWKRGWILDSLRYRDKSHHENCRMVFARILCGITELMPPVVELPVLKINRFLYSRIFIIFRYYPIIAYLHWAHFLFLIIGGFPCHAHSCVVQLMSWKKNSGELKMEATPGLLVN